MFSGKLDKQKYCVYSPSIKQERMLKMACVHIVWAQAGFFIQ